MIEIIEAFHFTKGMFRNLDNFDSYNDWMRDIFWLGDYAGYALFIVNQDKMLKKHPKAKDTIFELFVDSIIPFWEEEVEHVVKDRNNSRRLSYGFRTNGNVKD